MSVSKFLCVSHTKILKRSFIFLFYEEKGVSILQFYVCETHIKLQNAHPFLFIMLCYRLRLACLLDDGGKRFDEEWRSV
jgi:hypothetical protein